MINIYTLKHCSFCKEALATLDQEGILYNDIDADENDQLASKIESALSSAIYPMVSIPLGKRNTWIISATTEGRVMRSDCSIDYYQSIPHLITLIKKRITEYEK
jgi:glutaredoxin